MNAILRINKIEHEIIRLYYQFHCKTDFKGYPVSGTQGGSIILTLESTSKTDLLWNMCNNGFDSCYGAITIYGFNEDNAPLRHIEFEKASIYLYEEHMQAYTYLPMYIQIAITPLRMKIDKRVHIHREWPESIGGTWEHVKEQKVEWEKAPVREVLVSKVDGASTVMPGAEAEYNVVAYSVDHVGQGYKNQVKWVVEVDGTEYPQQERGEKLVLKIKEEWAGKELLVKPYLKEPSADVCVKTKVEKHRLSLFFDGNVLRFQVIEKSQKSIFSYKAVSGRALKDGSFDYSKERQKKKREGPIPEGKYHINPQEIQYTNDRTNWDKFKGILGGGTFRGGTTSWGIARVWIQPQSVVIDGVIRDFFSIHGGSEPGSAGCIDLTDNDLDFFIMLVRYRNDSTKIPLLVKY